MSGPVRMYGQMMYTISDIGSSIIFPVPANEISQTISGTNLIGTQYSTNQRYGLAFWGILGLNDCFPGLRFASDVAGGGSSIPRYFVNGKWQINPSSEALKLGYDSNLRKYIGKIPGASVLPEESWFIRGLVSNSTMDLHWKAQVLEAMENSKQINFIIDGMNILNAPIDILKEGYSNKIINTFWEMDQIITKGYWDKLHLWENGQEVSGVKFELWIERWKEIRDIP